MGCGGKASWPTMNYNFVIFSKLQKDHRKLDDRAKIRSQDFPPTKHQHCPFDPDVFNK
jgi:hypothetical protein